MTLGQSLLALGALSLTMYISVNVNRVVTSAVASTIDHYQETEAIHYSQSLVESEFSKPYESLVNLYTDVNISSKRLTYNGEYGKLFYATIHYSNEASMKLGTIGKIATIRVYEQYDGQSNLSVTRTIALIKPN
jgi:hypothetical protein